MCVCNYRIGGLCNTCPSIGICDNSTSTMIGCTSGTTKNGDSCTCSNGHILSGKCVKNQFEPNSQMSIYDSD